MSAKIVFRLNALCLALTVWSGRGGEIHVSPSGSDADPGTQEAPFRTLAKASEHLGPGDTCVIHEGTYRETMVVQRSGEPGRPVRIAARNSWATWPKS